MIAAVLLGACGDNLTAKFADGGTDAGDAAPDASPQAVGPCLDRPTDLPRPPTGALPCDLLPPGFVAPAGTN